MVSFFSCSSHLTHLHIKCQSISATLHARAILCGRCVCACCIYASCICALRVDVMSCEFEPTNPIQPTIFLYLRMRIAIVRLNEVKIGWFHWFHYLSCSSHPHIRTSAEPEAHRPSCAGHTVRSLCLRPLCLCPLWLRLLYLRPLYLRPLYLRPLCMRPSY